VLPLQHPLGHDVASQTHCPVAVLHSWPEGQPAQVAPPVPQEVLDSDAYASQVPAAVQHPFGHELALHTHRPVEVLHVCPVAHAAQAAPPAPQDRTDSLVSGSQVLPLQQPAHEEPLHVHVPPEHACPELQALHAAPAAPHSEADCEP
jgi:hypothetical protein